jgi:hypothetical protein
MKIIWWATIILIIPLGLVRGQQDSLIIDSVYVEQGQTLVTLPTYGVTFDSIDSYSLHFRCSAPFGGVNISPLISYFPPITSWDDRRDSLLEDHSIRMVGFADMGGDPNPPIFTNGIRNTLWNLAFNISPNAPPQVVTIDTVGALSFGSNSAFRRGYIIIGPLTGINDGRDRRPQEFTLLQNYPNPFNAQTTISYSLSQSGPVTLSIYNIMGQKVATMVDGVEPAGEHRVVWDAKGAASGVYFGRLENSNKTETVRMVLLR